MCSKNDIDDTSFADATIPNEKLKRKLKSGGLFMSILPLAACGGGGGGAAPAGNTPAPAPIPDPDFTESPTNVFVALDDSDRTLSEGGATANLTVTGKAGSDSITTGSGADTIIGAAGNDTIISSGGNDIVKGGTGNDTLSTGSGADKIRGGEGADTITAGDGNDAIVIVGTTTAGQYANGAITNSGGSEMNLSDLITLADLNGRTVSEVTAGETIDGGAGTNTLYIYGTVDLTGVTLNNVTVLVVNSDVTLSPEQIAQFTTVDGDGNSVINIEIPPGSTDNYILDLSALNMTDVGSIQIDGDITVVIDDASDLNGIGTISSGAGDELIVAVTGNGATTVVDLGDIADTFENVDAIEIDEDVTLEVSSASDISALGLSEITGDGDIDTGGDTDVIDALDNVDVDETVEVALPTISIDDISTNEEDEIDTFTVTLSETWDSVVTVDYNAPDGTSGTLTFNPGDTEKTFTSTWTDDNTDEVDETVNATLSNPSNATITDGTGVLTIDDDDGAPSISIDDISANEADETDTFTVSLSSASGKTISVDYDAPDGTNGTLTFNPGDTVKTFTSGWSNDNIDEVDETVSATLSNPSNATISDATGELTIIDDDGAPTISIDDISTNEADETDTFTVSLSAASAKTITVDYTAPDGTSGTLTFNPGQTSKTFTTAWSDDSLNEADQVADATLSNPSNATISDATGQLIIIDDDGEPSVRIDDISMNEADETAMFTVSLSNSSAKTITVNFLAPDGTFSLLTFNPGETEKTFDSSWTDDSTDEADEVVSATLSNPINVTIADGSGQLTIIDDDNAPTISIDDISASEIDETDTFTASLSAESGKTITVDYDAPDGTSGTLTFNPGETEKTFESTWADDAIDEADEVVDATLSNPSNATIADGTGELTIQDDDGVPAISVDDRSSNENVEAHGVYLRLSLPSDFTITVDYALSDGSNGTVTFNPGEIQQFIDITWTDDELDEEDEIITVTLSNPVNATILDGTANFTIRDEDPEPIITIDDISANEADEIDTFTVSLSAPSGKTVTVTYAAPDGGSGTLTFNPGETEKTFTSSWTDDDVDESDEIQTANILNATNALIEDYTATLTILDDDEGIPILNLLGSSLDESAESGTFIVRLSSPISKTVTVDYDSPDGTSGTLTFNPGETEKTFSFTWTDDDIVEPHEAMWATISNPTNATINQATTSFVIVNDDTTPPSVSINDISTNEADEIDTFTVSLSMESGYTITVDYNAPDGTNGTLTFNPGETEKTFTSSWTDDSIDEVDELVYATLSNPANATITDATGQLTILDDDPAPTISIIDNSRSEVNVSGVLRVTLSELSSETITVDYSATDGSSGTLTFNPGDRSKTILLTWADDAIDDDDEVITVTLSNPSNATIEDGVGQFTIIDNETTPSISINDIVVNEVDETATFTVSLSENSNLPVTVDYVAPDGSSGTLYFSPYQTEKSIITSWTNDIADEDNEVVFAILSNPTGGIISDATGQLTIIDDDGAPSISIDDISANEVDETDTFTVSLSAASGKTITVDYTAPDGTIGTLTFNPGETEKTFVSTWSDDSTDEADEVVSATLSNPSNATISDATGQLTIIDDDGAPSISIDDISANEADETDTFTVSLSAASGQEITVDYTAPDGTSGTLVFAAGETSKTFASTWTDDALDEADEVVSATLSNPSNATILDGSGELTIIDDDAPAEITVSPMADASGLLEMFESFLYPNQWGTSGQPLTITYSFPQSSDQYDPDTNWGGYGTTNTTLFDGYVPFEEDTQNSINLILDMFSKVTDITFVELKGDEAPDATLRFAASTALPTTRAEAFASFPGTNLRDGSMWFSAQTLDDLVPGSNFWTTVIHEIGHAAFGLTHPIDSSFPGYTNGLNSRDYTVMGASKYAPAAATPMAIDILAVQHQFGINSTTRSDDTVYNFRDLNETIIGWNDNGYDPSFIGYSGGQKHTIWDTGGEDTLSFSKEFGSFDIDIRSGHFSNNNRDRDLNQIDHSTFGSGSVFIGFDVDIEHAIGGYGDDHLIGNDLNNELTGGEGNDDIKGNGGDDIAILADNQNEYTIRRLQDGYELVHSSTGDVDYIHNDVEYIRFGDTGDLLLTDIVTSDALGSANNPIASGDVFVLPEGSQSIISLLDILANDTDDDGDGIWITDVSTLASNINLNIIGNELSISHEDGAPDEFEITYTLTDSHGDTDTGTINIFTSNMPDTIFDGDGLTELAFVSRHAKISTDGDRILSTTDRGILLYDSATNREIALPNPDDVGMDGWRFSYGALSENGRYVALTTDNNQAVIYDTDISSTTVVDIGSFIQTFPMFISIDGNSLIFSQTSNKIVYFDVSTNSVSDTVELPGSTLYLRDSNSDGSKLLVDTNAQMVAGDVDATRDLYAFDKNTDTWTIIEGTSNFDLGEPVKMTPDGRYVVFSTKSTLVGEDLNGREDVYRYDTQTDTLELVTITADDTQPSTWAGYTSISDDGQYVLFAYLGTDLIPGYNQTYNSYYYIRDMNSSEIRPVQVDYNLTNLRGDDFQAVLSGDGTTIVYYSTPQGEIYILDDTGLLITQTSANPFVDDNLRPNAVDDDIAPTADDVISISIAELLSNDSDYDGDSLTISAIGNTRNATAEIVGSDIIVTRLGGIDDQNWSFDYVVSDGNGGFSQATARGWNTGYFQVYTGKNTVVEGETLFIGLSFIGPDNGPLIQTEDHIIHVRIVPISENGTVADFGSLKFDVTIPAGLNAATFQFNPVADGLVEGVEKFAILIENELAMEIKNSFSPTNGSITTATINVLDEDFTIGYDSLNFRDIITATDDDNYLGGITKLLNTEFFGEGGNDEIYGYHGDDILHGGAGNDKLFAGDDDDEVYGGIGEDEIDGGRGNDILNGEEGNDTILAGPGDDIVSGGLGDDYIDGHDGNDQLDGNGGADTLRSGYGNDIINGGSEDDTIITFDPENDTIDGGTGIDTLHLIDVGFSVDLTTILDNTSITSIEKIQC